MVTLAFTQAGIVVVCVQVLEYTGEDLGQPAGVLARGQLPRARNI